MNTTGKTDKIKISYACATNMGKIREENQDNFYIDGKTAGGGNEARAVSGVFEKEQIIAAVCDGMGGEANGKDASALAADWVRKADEALNKDIDSDIDGFILKYINSANDDVYQMSVNAGDLGGSTVNLVYINGNMAISYNLGDSRTYLFRDDKLTQLSRDHTTVADMVRLGSLTEEEARRHPRRNQLNQFVGVSTKRFKLDPHISDNVALRDNDMLLICSDGLTDMCEIREIIEIMSADKELKSIVDDLVNAALERGGLDNITVMLLAARA